MSTNEAGIKQRAVNQFWHNYLSILDKSLVPITSRRWYRRPIETYIAAYRDVKLQQYLPSHVDEYLFTKGRVIIFDKMKI